MATWAWILIVVVVVVVAALAIVATRQRRRTELRRRFGPEYDRTVEAAEDRRAAEAELRGREKWRAELDIRPLPEEARVRYAHEWQDVQEHFVDQPSDAVAAADRLIYSVMEARGYPVGDFDAQADLVSVDHAEVVENYRYAHGIHQRVRQASTEDLREALVRYRSLFDELLRADVDGGAVVGRAAIDETPADGMAIDAAAVSQADVDEAAAGQSDADDAAVDDADVDPAAEERTGDPVGISARSRPIVRPDQEIRPADESEVPGERP
jgi:hypothetical protein